MARRKPAYLTTHAKERWRERLGTQPNGRLLAHAVLVPDRHALTVWGSWKAQLARAHHGHAGVTTAFRVTSTAVLVCSGRAVVTVYPLSVDDLATVLTWLMTGHWITGPSEPPSGS